MRGWIDLTCGKENYTKKAIKYFDDVLKMNESMFSVAYHCSLHFFGVYSF